MLNWLKTRLQVQRVQMDHDLLAIIEQWPNLNRQQRDRVKLLVIQAGRSKTAEARHNLDSDVPAKNRESSTPEKK